VQPAEFKPEFQPDFLDEQIIEQLRRNAKATLSEIGQTVGLSAPAVKRRVDRLEAEKVILGYTVVVDHARLGQSIEAFAALRFAGTARVDEIATIADDIDEVEAVFTMAGDPDALVWIRVRDVGELKGVIDKIRNSGRVIDTKTLMVLGRSMKITR
jgi:Lrp/AsnC family transcriptional regulator, leucine-responsive regulatory protein